MGKIKNKKKADTPIDTTMSLGDHLEELRARLILAILGLLVGTAICLFLGRRVIRFIEGPYIREIQKHNIELQKKQTWNDSTNFIEVLCSNILEVMATDPNAPDFDPKIVEFIRKVYTDTIKAPDQDPNSITTGEIKDQIPQNQRLQILAPADAFVGYMKISLISGLILSSPWVFYQLWMFIAAGLYSYERRYVRIAVPFSSALFVIGALFFLFVVAPISLGFFLSFGDYIGVSSNWTFQKYISFITMLMLVFGLGFQTPIAIFVLNRTGLLSIKSLRASRRYVFIGVFAVAAIATPPDVISQITLALPLYVLFELGIYLSWFAERKRKSHNDVK